MNNIGRKELRFEFVMALGYSSGLQSFWSPTISSTPSTVKAVKNYMQSIINKRKRYICVAICTLISQTRLYLSFSKEMSRYLIM